MSAPTPKEIRECYADYRNEWLDIRDEAATDMRYITGDPWDPEDKEQRKQAGRPCISLDELNQYLNQYINNLRQNKRAPQVMPKGEGANDADAKRRASLLMGIEERSQAQLAYITAAENAAQRSYGFARLVTEYRDDSTFDQEILVKPILNPDTVLISPNYKQPDASDIEDGFLLDMWTKRAYRDKFGKAPELKDFSADDTPGVSDWIKEKFVQIAEFWRIEHDKSKLLLIQLRGDAGGKGPQIYTEDGWKQQKAAGAEGEVKRERDVMTPRVVQYYTNGVEILDTVDWAGTRIPILSCFGKEVWMTEGGKAVRKLISMIRLARDPQMLFAFLATQECEEAGMIPKVPFVGAVGQFETDEETWDELNKVPHAYVQYDPVVDTATKTVLPAPTRPQWTPNFEQYELAKDSARRSIQAAMGITPMPTAMQRAQQKSGVAMDRVDDMQAIGSFHFTDNYDRFLHNAAWQMNELVTPILDTQREMAITKADGTRTTLHVIGKTSHPINDQGAYDVQTLPKGKDGQPIEHVHTGKGEFDVTISTGPSRESERQEQDEFADHLIENWQELGIPAPIGNKILALAIKLKPTLGAIGVEIATLLDPPDPSNLPPEAQAIVQQLQSQIQQLTQENSTMHMERAAKVLELKSKETIEAMKGHHVLDKSTMEFITQIIKAELAAKSKADEITAQTDAQHELAVLDFGHEAGMSAMEHGQSIDAASHAAAIAPAPVAPGAAGATPGPGTAQ